MSDTQSTQFVQILTTTEHEEDARAIARQLVERRLAACVQIVGPIESVYRWKGNVQTAREWRCEAKTTIALCRKATEAIAAIHPYETPEIIALPISGMNDGYRQWLLNQTGESH